ncbi:peptidoglycan-binding protein [Sporosarcina globispora]|uniref:Peptidoglycan-binding protein n=1 Tax=Sporosarcina globispora TaxID=1459 RepID=A0A0M0GFZ9_SPOGL|nr:peptidoglycan-binding protein [Sporosarcina globispora]KON88840.1 peptidoglycan-binding protein [Sporosarcina globispora]
MNNHNYTRQSTGKLMVFIFEGDKVKPIMGAKVTITGHNQNVTQQSNESGQTNTVDLPAGEPYFEYTVNVSASGYNDVKFEGVQVVPNITGIQEIQMTPSIRRDNFRSTEEHKVPPHKLTQPEAIKPDIDPIAIPDPQPQPLPLPQTRPEGPLILIPEYIIVHCGAPQEPAPKYKVKFTDYITKVACAETYPGWHREALIANILCITSYTLNKIFTQAYTGFDVTCLIQFDLKYNHVQTTYKQIIEIVDTIFNLYIKHPDPVKNQPLLAEYRAHYTRQKPCKLGQFKSQELAKQGYNHQDILNYFYDLCYGPLKIASAAGVIFQGRSSTPPETILKEGSSGSDVRKIQVMLNEISKNYSKIPKINADGKFGSITTKAVKTFQQIFNIHQDGNVDFRTWYKMSAIYYSILEYR